MSATRKVPDGIREEHALGRSGLPFFDSVCDSDNLRDVLALWRIPSMLLHA
jgi:hypothetical protein